MQRKALKGFDAPGLGRVNAGETFDDSRLTAEDDAWLVSKGAIEKPKGTRLLPRRRSTKGVNSG